MLPWSRAKRFKILPTVQGCGEEVPGGPFDGDGGKSSHSSAGKIRQGSAASLPTRKCAGSRKEGTGRICADNADPNHGSATTMRTRTARPLTRHGLHMPLLCFPNRTQAILERVYISSEYY